jgi:hypothetical protein
MRGIMRVLDNQAYLIEDDLPEGFADGLLASLRVALARMA